MGRQALPPIADEGKSCSPPRWGSAAAGGEGVGGGFLGASPQLEGDLGGGSPGGGGPPKGFWVGRGRERPRGKQNRPPPRPRGGASARPPLQRWPGPARRRPGPPRSS